MFSVVIPVGGGRMKNLQNVLHSLTLQTFKDFEVIVVNDGSSDDILSVCNLFPTLDVDYVYGKKFEIGKDIPPRNKGARLARYPFLIFLDSDVILDKQAMEFYAEDFDKNPIGIVAGLYDWLFPCRIGPDEIERGLDSIYHIDGDHLVMDIKMQDWPKGHQTHNACRDMRRPMFMETNPSVVYTGPGNMNVYLGMFSGNLGFAAKTFWGAGGYWDSLTPGIVDDGAFGLTNWVLSAKRDDTGRLLTDENGEPIPDPMFGVRLDKRIRGAHQYHDRNVQFVQVTSTREVDLINRRFRLEKYADGGIPIIPKPVYELTREAQVSWGVDKWEKRWDK